MKAKLIVSLGALLSLIVAFLLSGCGSGDIAGEAETTPAHLAEGVTAELGEGSDAVALAEAPMATQDYVVQKGDTLGGLASKFSVPVDSIKKANSMEGDTIYYGKTLKIPAPARTVAAAASAIETVSATPSTAASAPDESTFSSPVTPPTTAPATTTPKPETPASNAADASLPVIPPTPSTPTSSSVAPRQSSSIGAAFGGGQNPDKATTSPQPRMPGASSISPFYDNADTGATPIPPVSGKTGSATEKAADKPEIPLPRE